MSAPKRNLLVGLLAVETGLVSEGQLVDALGTWRFNKAHSITDHLEARGEVTAEARARLEEMATFQIEEHQGDVEKALAAVPASTSTLESLAAMGDLDISPTLERILARSRSTEDGNPGRTSSDSAGAAARTASGSGCCGPTRAAAWARSSWLWTAS